MCAMFFFRWKLDKLRDTMDKKENLWVEEKKVGINHALLLWVYVHAAMRREIREGVVVAATTRNNANNTYTTAPPSPIAFIDDPSGSHPDERGHSEVSRARARGRVRGAVPRGGGDGWHEDGVHAPGRDEEPARGEGQEVSDVYITGACHVTSMTAMYCAAPRTWPLGDMCSLGYCSVRGPYLDTCFNVRGMYINYNQRDNECMHSKCTHCATKPCSFSSSPSRQQQHEQ